MSSTSNVLKGTTRQSQRNFLLQLNSTPCRIELYMNVCYAVHLFTKQAHTYLANIVPQHTFHGQAMADLSLDLNWSPALHC